MLQEAVQALAPRPWRPKKAFFGQKDLQQLQIVKALVKKIFYLIKMDLVLAECNLMFIKMLNFRIIYIKDKKIKKYYDKY